MRHTGTLLIFAALLVALVVPVWLGGRHAVFASFDLATHAYLAIVALAVFGWSMRALKQWLLIQRLGLAVGAWRNLAISLAIDFAFLATPGGVGGYAAGIWYLRGIGASYAQATALAAADQVLDLMFFAIAMPVAALCLSQTAELSPWLAHGAAFGGIVALALLVALVLARRPIGAWFFGARGPLARIAFLRRRRNALRGFVDNVLAQTRVLMRGSPAYFALAFASTAVQWLARYGVLWLILTLFGAYVPFSLALLLQGVVLHVAQWTGMPAGGGGADLGLAATLAPFVATATVASALLLWRIATLYLNLLAGMISIVALRWQPGKQNDLTGGYADEHR
ncbi:MAG: lysylphosphatidylglycerol synthase transmembrane domain-containing protein [Rudaea sp.]|uniref:lysylphosphatidylglycerol synthase transmembrane domain-containing protein n=1 Tax=Rudaea sp. TaxID=2136325 RepID=UPI0039E23D4F